MAQGKSTRKIPQAAKRGQTNTTSRVGNADPGQTPIIGDHRTTTVVVGASTRNGAGGGQPGGAAPPSAGAPGAPGAPGGSDGKTPTRRATDGTIYLRDFGFPNRLPVMPLLSVVVFPHNVISFIVRKAHNVQMLEEIGDREKVMCLVGQRDSAPDTPTSPDHLFPVGVAARLIHRMKLPDGSVQVAFQGIARVTIGELVSSEPYLRANVTPTGENGTGAVEPESKSVEASAMMGSVLELFSQVVASNPSYSPELTEILKANIEGPGRFADMIATFVAFPLSVKFELLAELDPMRRLAKLAGYLEMELKKSQVASDVQKAVKVEVEKSQRDYILRQQLAAIRKELGEGDDATAEVAKLRERIAAAGMPETARTRAEDELRRLEQINPASAEYTVARNYLEWLVTLPWSKSSPDKLDLTNARKVLDAGHYGLKEVKDRIIEFLAVMKLRGDTTGSILCLQGPPGVGKTSLGKGIAEALGREFQRISVGGLRDDSEIMGHRRTYVGAMPGKIMDAMKRAGTINPLLMIDEIDKMGNDYRGDPASAMLEVLDPSQNTSFRDRFIDLPYDLSRVLFITTANSLETIPRPLLDRMEVIQIPGYTRLEKLEIAKRHLVSRQIAANGLKDVNVEFRESALEAIIDGHTREAGVRNLERTIGSACRKVAVAITSKKRRAHVITAKNLESFIGPPRVMRDPRLTSPEVGVATGLAWTAVGGELLFIEATRYKGKGNLKITGQLGDVMKESVHAALSYVHANAAALGIDEAVFETQDIHVHFPEGATPKDGPSAGAAIVTALASLLTDRPVRPNVAMTGEVTLRGRILRIGGVREKVMAAHRAGITRVILPKSNERDLEDVPDEVKKEMTFVFSEHVSTNLKEALSEIVLAKA
jgi:ATP-dependent Lon protease